MKRIRLTAVVEVKDDDLAESIVRRYIIPELSELTSAYWRIGSLVDAGAQDQREWIEAELATVRYYENQAKENMRAAALAMIDEARKGSWRDQDCALLALNTAADLIRAVSSQT